MAKRYDFLTIQMTRHVGGFWHWHIEGENVVTGSCETLEDGNKEYRCVTVAAADAERALDAHLAKNASRAA